MYNKIKQTRDESAERGNNWIRGEKPAADYRVCMYTLPKLILFHKWNK